MNEKFSHRGFDKIVGLTNEMKQRSGEVNAYIDHLVDERGGKWIEEFEVEKTNREKEVIDFVNTEADRILEELGRKNPTEIAESNIHILRKNGTYDYTEGRLQGGSHATTRGSVLVDRQDSDIQFALVLFHELMHMKVYKALQLLEKEEGNDLYAYRSGFSVTDREGKNTYFIALEEAMIGYLTKKFYDDVLMKSPLFIDEVIAKGENYDHKISRMEELGFLNKLVDDLWKQNKDTFETRDDVFKLFVDAHVNGHLLQVGKLVEKTFGKGSFRRLAETTGELQG